MTRRRSGAIARRALPARMRGNCVKSERQIDILLFGAGGHAKVASDCARADYPNQMMLSGDGTEGWWRHVPIVPQGEKSLSEWKSVCPRAFVAIGDSEIRERVTLSLEATGFSLATLIHPSAVVSPSARLESGVLVCPGAVINADARIERGCIVNTGAIVEHECEIGAFSHIAPRAVLGGGAVLGHHCRVCLGAVVSDHISVGCHATIGASAAVLSSVPPHVLAVGVPAQVRKRDFVK